MGQISAERPLARARVVRRSHRREMEEPDIVERVRREHDDRCRLRDVPAAGIRVPNAGNAALLMQNATHPAPRSQLERLLCAQHREQRVRRLRLRPDHAPKPLAVAAVLAGAARHTVGVCVRLAQER